MSFFPRSFANEPASSFTPLFRLLDDYDSYTNTNSHKHNHNHRNGNSSIMKTFSPKFDVKETQDGYELHGELPGIEQKDVEIEFTDAQTLAVKGRVERSHHASSPSASGIEGAKPVGAIEGKDSKAHKATVEDEDAVANAKEGAKTEGTLTEVAKAEEKPKERAKEPEVKYWISERSVGEFSRTFTFPVRVDQDAVSASMRNGVLTVMVPKAKKAESRKITIS